MKAPDMDSLIAALTLYGIAVFGCGVVAGAFVRRRV
jgi:hypothetical protein